MIMHLPPGPAYLLHAFLYYTPSLLVCIAFLVLQVYSHAFQCVPKFLPIFIALTARPFYTFLCIYYADFMNKSTAARLGAVLPPVVQEGTVSLISRMAESMKNGYPAELMLELSKTYGSAFRLDMRPLPAVFVTMEPDHVKAILTSQFESFSKGDVFKGQFDSLLGTGVFNSDGEMWKFHRSITRPFFVRERISDFEIYDRTATSALCLAKSRLEEGVSIDFQDLTARFSLDSATEFLFGANVDSLSAGLPYPPTLISRTPQSFHDHPSTPFVKALGRAQELAMLRANYGPAWPLAEFWADEVKPLRKVVDEFVAPLMRNAFEAHAPGLEAGMRKDTQEKSNVLAHLVGETQDPQVIQDELINLLVAGRDTISSLLTFSFYMLTQHPDIEQRLRDEILEFIGPTGNPTYEHMREMKYTRAFLNEVLRMYPPVPSDTRWSDKPVVLPATRTGLRSIFIPAGTTCTYNIINMHRRKDLWGPDALVFDPNRFLDSRLQQYLIPNPFIFCPFNAGPRICIGQQFAYHEATFFLVRLLQQFTGFQLDESLNATPPEQWKAQDELMREERIYSKAHIIMYVKDGLWVKMKELKSP